MKSERVAILIDGDWGTGAIGGSEIVVDTGTGADFTGGGEGI